MNLKRLSQAVSRIFDFYVWFPIVLVATVFNSGLATFQIRILLPILLILNVVLPVSYFFMDLAGKGLGDIDVTKRQQRYHLFARLVMINLISAILSYFLGNDTFFVLQFTNLCLSTSLFLITFFYKISGHMILNVSSVLILNFLFDWRLLWLFLIIPLVALARIYLKKHTLGEVLWGIIVGLAVPLAIFKVFTLI